MEIVSFVVLENRNTSPIDEREETDNVAGSHTGRKDENDMLTGNRFYWRS